MSQDQKLSNVASRQSTSREFLAVLFRRKWVILGLFAVTTATVLIASLTTPTEYVSSGKVMIMRGEKESVLLPGRRVYSDWEQDMGTELEVARSAPVVERARALLAEDAGPGRTPLSINTRRVDVEVYGRTNVIALGYKDRDPQVAKAVCDALVRAHVEFRQNNFSLAYPRDFFEGEMGRVEKDLNHWVTMRRNFAQGSGVVDVGEERRSLIATLGIQAQRREELLADLAEAEASWGQMAQLRDRQNVDLPTFTSTYSNEAALIDLKGRVVNAEFRLAQLRETLRDDAPEVGAARVTLDTLRAIMSREVDARISMTGARLDMLKARLAVVERSIQHDRERLDGMPAQEMTIAEMDRQIAVLKDRYTSLSRSSDQARITENTTPLRNVVLLARAGNAVPTNRRDYVRLALAPAFSLLVGIGIAFFLDGLDLTVRTAAHAEEAIELPVLATLVERRRTRRLRPRLTVETPAA